jgi:Glycosyltransferase family 87
MGWGSTRPVEYNPSPARLSERRTPLLFFGLLLIAAGVFASWAESTRQGHDYASIYLTASGVLTKSPIYDARWQKAAFLRCCGIAFPQGMFYPPATGLITLPLGLVPYPYAHVAWLVLLIGVLLLGARALIRLARPSAPRHYWMIATGLVLLSACVRWGMTPAQGAPLLLGLLCIFVVALHRGWSVAIFFIGAIAATLKPTLALPFLGLILLHRRYWTFAGVLATLISLNVVGFARLGGLSAAAAYQNNVRILEALGDINTPDPWSLLSVPRVDWIYLFYGLGGNLLASRVATLILAGGTALWLLRESRQVRGPIELSVTAAFLAPLVYLANASVYHHHYDISLIIAPLLLSWFGSRRLRRPGWATVLLVPFLVVIGIVPVERTRDLILNRFGSRGPGFVNLMFPITMTLAMIGSLVILHRLLAPRIQSQRAT